MSIESMNVVIPSTLKNRFKMIFTCLFKKKIEMIFTNPSFLVNNIVKIDKEFMEKRK